MPPAGWVWSRTTTPLVALATRGVPYVALPPETHTSLLHQQYRRLTSVPVQTWAVPLGLREIFAQ